MAKEVAKSFESLQAIEKKHGTAFTRDIMKELKTNWWTGGKYNVKIPDTGGHLGKLTDEQTVVLGISLRATMACRARDTQYNQDDPKR
jgi:hypothetical protein